MTFSNCKASLYTDDYIKLVTVLCSLFLVYVAVTVKSSPLPDINLERHHIFQIFFYRRRPSFDRVGAFTSNWATLIQRVCGSEECRGHMLYEFSNSTGRLQGFSILSYG